MRGSTNSLRRAGEVFLFYVMLTWLGLMLLTGNALCTSLFFAPRAFREPIMQRAISATCRLFLGGMSMVGLMHTDLRALDVLNGQRNLVLVANHPSMIDVFLIVSRLEHPICLFKASIGTNIFLGFGAHLAGYISNRQTVAMLRTAAGEVSRGAVLLTFPEGTRTTRQPLNVLKPGAAFIARRANAPLQTILLLTNSPYLGKGWNILRPPSFPLVYKAALGERFAPGPTTAATVANLQRYFESKIVRSIDAGLSV